MLDKKLIVLEMANNHMGDVDHGKEIIRHFSKVTAAYKEFDFAFKFQYRQLESFIHKDYKNRLDIHYIKRFSETKLSDEEFLELKKFAESHGFKTICTPFDNESVGKVVEHGYDFIKVASCSFTDWSLIKEIAEQKLPIITSTGGATKEDIDNVVDFFLGKNKNLTLLHCIPEYPTDALNQNLGQIRFFQENWPGLPIGLSTHEHPENTQNIALALAADVRVVEKHVGLQTEKYDLNKYSAIPEHLESWLAKARETENVLGARYERLKISATSASSINKLKRGVFAKRSLKVGETLDESNSYLAFPAEEIQMKASDLSPYESFQLIEDIEIDRPVYFSNVQRKSKDESVCP